jgi:hypothetical protein
MAVRDMRCAMHAGMAGEAEHAAKATASVLIVVANCLVQAAAYSDAPNFQDLPNARFLGGSRR